MFLKNDFEPVFRGIRWRFGESSLIKKLKYFLCHKINRENDNQRNTPNFSKSDLCNV